MMSKVIYVGWGWITIPPMTDAAIFGWTGNHSHVNSPSPAPNFWRLDMDWEQFISMWIGRVMVCTGGICLIVFLLVMAGDYVFYRMRTLSAFAHFLIKEGWAGSRKGVKDERIQRYGQDEIIGS
jgi:hypothetical protein